MIGLGCQYQEGPFSNFYKFNKEGLCHLELLTTLEVKDVQVWEWHHIIVHRRHFFPSVSSTNDGTRIRFPLLAFRVICDDKLELRQKQCPSSLVSIQKWLVMKYYKFLWSEYTLISCWALLSKWHHSSKASMMTRIFFIMNLIINFCRFTKMEANRMNFFCLLQVVKARHLLQSQKHLSPK